MDRIIEVKVNGNYLTKDSDNAGVQHEANVTALRMEFDPGWDGYAKKVTWWDALGENPVERTLTADLLEDITASTRIYLCPIPGEALTEAGRCTFVIDGYVSGKRQRSVYGTLKVNAAPFLEEDERRDLTPTQAEQLQAQIDTLLSDLQEQAATAVEAAEGAAGSEAAARASAESARASADNARASETAARAACLAAEEARDQAQAIAAGDFATRSEAKGYARTAEDNAKSYTDERIAAIPTADPSGAIADHNADRTAHADLRTALSGKADNTHAGQHASDGADPITPAAIGAETAGAVSAHDSDSGAHGGLRAYVDAQFGALEAALGSISEALDSINGEVV